MTQEEKEDAILTVLGRCLLSQRLPMLLRIRERLNLGEVLSDYDIRFLRTGFSDAQNNMALLYQHPEYQPLSAELLRLYQEIMALAWQNESAREDRP
ncbi:hypothetical protein [Undibacterium sp.]|uniref:hypothetical protein n=1 Tax=Undibacterium sp. TaxID=1914977 RepID=UPI0025D1C601|nr:hypothetical protein [Undibacterium sp.]